MTPEASEPPVYDVRLSEASEVDIDALMLRLAAHSPDMAVRWHDGLLAAFRSLTQLPHRCTLAPENALFEREVRQLLYWQGKSVCRVLFMVFDADGDEPGFVRVMRVLSGARRLERNPGPQDDN